MSKFTFADGTLRILGACVALLMCLSGSYCFADCSVNIRDWVVSAIICVTGFMLAVAELGHWIKKIKSMRPLVTKWLYFLKHRTGRAFAYIIGGCLSLTNIWWMVAIGLANVAIGLLNIATVLWLHRCCGCKGPKQEPKGESVALPTLSGEQPEASLTQNAV